MLTNKTDYVAYVKSVLETIMPEDKVVASYDTGHGLSLVSEDLGDSPMTLFVVQNRVAKVMPPMIKDMDEWDEAWAEGKKLVREFIEGRNRG